MKCVLVALMPALIAAGEVSSQGPVVHPDLWPAAKWPLDANAAEERRIARLLKRMTLAEKVGQIVQADIASVTPDEARDYHLGSILNGGNSAPGGDEFAPPAKWLALADAFYEASVDRRGGRAAIPIIWGTDAVHGHSNVVGATIFPHNIGLGAARDPALIERIGRATAAEIRATGIEWTFAPTVTVPQDYRWGRAYEGYSSDPALVAAYTGRMIAGLQGAPNSRSLLAGPYVLASTKHFLADGGTSEGRDQGDALIDEAALRDVHGAPYVPAVEAGVATVMTSFSSWQGTKISGHRGLVTGILKDRLNFGGFVVTDWNAHGQVAGCTNASCPIAVNAGVDMLMAPDTWKPLYHSLLAQVRDGTIPVSRLDDAVARVLRAKMRLGLFEAGKPSTRPLAGKFELLGSAEHRAIAREAVRKSLVLLKAQDGVLPIKPGSSVLVAGDGADDVARQSGGWTITWQGTGVSNKDFPGATSIWAGLRDAVSAAGGRATLSPDGRFETRPDVAIVVFGETPYAEFQGDLKSLQLRSDLTTPWATMKRLKAQGIPVVALMITGRPLFVNPALNHADAFVVAWLPGSEGGGIADMLVGTRANGEAPEFSGRLPAAWPATARHDGPVLFERGYGLSLSAPETPWVARSEDAGVIDEGVEGIYFDKGKAAAAWSLIVGDGAADNTRVTTLPATVLGGRGRVVAIDHLVQEGALQLSLASGGAAVVALTTHAPLDLTREANGDVMVIATMRLDTRSEVPTTLGLTCGSGCAAEVPAPAVATLPLGEWRTVGIRLKCFANAGGTLSRVDAPFRLSTHGAMTISIARVALGTVADVVQECQAR